MKIALKWVNELTNTETIFVDELVEKLTLGGFEVDGLIETQIGNHKQITLDVSTTANRSDSLSIQGISAEISALLDQPLKELKHLRKKVDWSTKFANQVQLFSVNADCQAFFALTVENIVTLTSPKWLKQKLLDSGRSPKNNLQDFQAYVQLETGYPIELYDLDKIFLKLGNNQEFTLRLTSFNNTKEVFADSFSIGLAGITCNEDMRCSNQTRKILIEGSIFKAAMVRQQSRFIGLRTDRSTRYEKSIKDSSLIEACYRLITLLRIQNPDLVCSLHTSSKVEAKTLPTIHLNYPHVQEILGPVQESSSNKTRFILPQQVTKYLARLKLESEYDVSMQSWNVKIPDLRSNDILEEIDLIEEVGRLHGFDNFLTQLPSIKRIGIEDQSYKIRKELTHVFLSMGLTEFIHYSLINSELRQTSTATLINPLLSEYSDLRVSLLPSLIQTSIKNIKQGNLPLDGFEYGHIFFTDNSTDVYEKEIVAGMFGPAKIKSTWSKLGQPITWFEAKGRLEQFFERLSLPISWEPLTSDEQDFILHPYRMSKLILSDNLKLGIFGQIHPVLAKKENVPLETYLFELDFEMIKKFKEKVIMTNFKNYSLYPRITKDLTFNSPNDISFEKLKEFLQINGTRFLTDIKLLDKYIGVSTPSGHVSLCIQFIFQSNVETLEGKQIEKLLHDLKLALKKKFNISIRE